MCERLLSIVEEAPEGSMLNEIEDIKPISGLGDEEEINGTICITLKDPTIVESLLPTSAPKKVQPKTPVALDKFELKSIGSLESVF